MSQHPTMRQLLTALWELHSARLVLCPSNLAETPLLRDWEHAQSRGLLGRSGHGRQRRQDYARDAMRGLAACGLLQARWMPEAWERLGEEGYSFTEAGLAALVDMRPSTPT